VLALPGRKHVRCPGHPASEAGQAQGPAPAVRIIAVRQSRLLEFMKAHKPSPDADIARKTFIRLFRFYGHDSNVSDSLRHLPGETGELLSRLRNCSKSDPDAFIPFFDKIIVSDKIPDACAAPIADGIIDHLLTHSPSAETSDAPAALAHLARTLIHWLDCHSFLWEKSKGIPDVLSLCCHLLGDPWDADPLLFCLLRLAGHKDPEAPEDKASVSDAELHDVSCHSVRGKIAGSAMRLASNLLKNGKPLPPLLFPLLFRFATDAHPGVRKAILSELADFGQYDAEGAWKLSNAIFQSPNPFLWEDAEAFLCGQCDENFSKVQTCLRGIQNGKTRGKVSAWAFLSGHLPEDQFLSELVSDSAVRTGVAEAFEMKLFHERNTDKAFLIANRFVSVLQRTGNGQTPEWFSKWIFELSGKKPLLAAQIRDHLRTGVGAALTAKSGPAQCCRLRDK